MDTPSELKVLCLNSEFDFYLFHPIYPHFDQFWPWSWLGTGHEAMLVELIGLVGLRNEIQEKY